MAPSKDEKKTKAAPLNPKIRQVRKILDSPAMKVFSGFAILFALFGGYLWQLFDLPDDPSNVLLDLLMTSVTLFFIVEMIMLSVAQPDYLHWYSFFLWMDCLGTFSMIFELSFLMGSAGKMENQGAGGVNSMVMRSARATKMAARAGRLVRVTKFLSWFSEERNEDGTQRKKANVLSKKMMIVLSTRVSSTVILLVMIFPLFSLGTYPETDLSMVNWATTLESSYFQDASTSSQLVPRMSFRTNAAQMNHFYQERFESCYRPYKMEGFPSPVTFSGKAVTIAGSPIVDREGPNRLQNAMSVEVRQCTFARVGCSCTESCEQGDDVAKLYFDFTDCKRYSAGMELLSIIFIVVLMIGSTFFISRVVDALAIKPLELMMGMVRDHAGQFLDAFDVIDGCDDDVDIDTVEKDEAELLEVVFKKLAKLAAIATDTGVDSEAMALLDDESRGVLVDMMGADTSGIGVFERAQTMHAVGHEVADLVSVGGVELSKIESWELDLLDLSGEARAEVVLFMFFDSKLGSVAGRKFASPETFSRFYGEAMGNYYDQPYHNAIHACDVLHTVWRLCSVTMADKWVQPVEIYALMIAALGHDLGHQGMTNPFLVETGDELALRYNDASPLENMHCATLFTICTKAECNVFKLITEKDQYKLARKTVVKTILHTDNANHFDMVKDVKKAFEMNQEICDKQAELVANGDSKRLDPDYEKDVLKKDHLLWLELFLHFADVSNPLKPFDICQAWAWRVLDEFFNQGDEEKRLGLPVGMLNDRDKINKPGSQHGFINFLVAPLVFATVQVFPPLHPLSTQMGSNLQEWRNLWVDNAKPDNEAIDKKDADVKKVQDQAEVLRIRASPTMVKDTGRRQSQKLKDSE